MSHILGQNKIIVVKSEKGVTLDYLTGARRHRIWFRKDGHLSILMLEWLIDEGLSIEMINNTDEAKFEFIFKNKIKSELAFEYLINNS